MKYSFRGALRGRLAREFEVPLDTVDIRLYDVDREKLDDEDIVEATGARPKETFSILTESDVEEKRDRLIAEGTTENDGSFTVDIDESADYTSDKQRRPDVFQLDVRVTTVPETRIEPDSPVQFTLTIHDPAWEPPEPGTGEQATAISGPSAAELEEQQAELMVAQYQTVIPEKLWCAVLEAAGIWVVCGRVTVKNTTAPVPDMTVTAKDADIIQHDELGSDVTDSDGRYSIYYRAADFEETPPPWGPIELIPGPDLYFTVERQGNTFLDEDPSAGRAGGRENADHCEYIEIPIDFEEKEPPTGSPTMPTLWDSVGRSFDVTSDFDSEGYAGTEKYALYRNITTHGQAPLYHRRNPDQFVEYRFLVAENPGDPNPDYKPIGVGSQPHLDAFVDGLTVGTVLVSQQNAPLPEFVPVNIAKSHLDSDGWLSVKDAANDALNARFGTGLSSLSHGQHSWFDSDELMRINTRQFTSEPDVRDAATANQLPEAGEAVPASLKIDTEKIGIKFEARVIDENGNELQNPQDVHTYELSPVVINNNSAFVEFVNNNHEQANDKCKILSGDVDLGYTVYHPHLEGLKIGVRRNSEDQPYPQSISLSDSNLTYDFTPSPGQNLDTDADAHFHNQAINIPRESGSTPDPILTKKCGYEAAIHVQRRLHNGYHADDWDTEGSSIFYWDG